MSVEFTVDDALSYSIKNGHNFISGYIISTTSFNEFVIVCIVKNNPEKCVQDLQKICDDNNISDWGILLRNTELSQKAMYIIRKYQ